MRLLHVTKVLFAGADGSWIALLPGSSNDGRPAKCHPFHPDLEVRIGPEIVLSVELECMHHSILHGH